MFDFVGFTPKATVVLLLFCTAWLGGCTDQSTGADATESSNVLARVGGEPITEADLQHMLKRSFSDEQSVTVNAELRRTVLDSLIASRAMKLLAQEQMAASEAERIAANVRAYEEELYVKAYLERNIDPRPVTGEMVRHYYEQNPEQFGSEVRRHFELLVAPANLDEQRQARLLAEVPAIRSHDNWSQGQAQWEQQYGLHFQRGQSRPGLLHDALESALGRLEEGETSSVVYVDGQLHLVRVSELRRSPPKPLAEVRGDIRRTLAPLHLREAVRQASEEARAKVDVEITTDRQPPSE